MVKLPSVQCDRPWTDAIAHSKSLLERNKLHASKATLESTFILLP
jgi:hypothetical protein